MDASTVVVRIMANSTGLTAGLTKASGSMAAFGRKTQAVGMGLTKYLTLPIVAAGAATVVMAASFESSMKLIQTQAGGSAKDVQVLSQAILGMKDVQHSPKQLADAMYHLKSVGMDNAHAMAALTASEHLASVGHADLEATTNAVAGAFKSGISGAQDFGKAVGTINAIIGAGNMRMDDFNSAMGTGVGVTARQFGVSLTSLGASLSMITSRGIPATRAAMSLRMAMQMMGAPTAAAAKVMGSLGLSTTDLAKAMRAGGLVEAIGMLKDHLAGLSKVDATAALSKMFGARSSGAILTLIGNLKDFQRVQDQIVTNSDKFWGMVGAQAQDTEAKWKKFLSTMQNNAVKLGNVLLPIASSLADGLGRVADAFGNLSAGTQSFIVKVGVAAAVAGPFVLGISRMVGVLLSLRTAMLGAAAAQATMAATGAGGGLAAVGASATTAAAGVRTFYAAASGAASTSTALAASGVSAGAAMAALGVSAGAAVVTMGALAVAAQKVYNLMVKIQSDPSVAGTVAADLADMVKGIGRELPELVSKMASGAMSMGKGQKYLSGFVDTLRQVRKEAVKVGDAKMIAQIDNLIGGYKGLQGQFVKLGGIGFKVGGGVRDMQLVNTAITTVKGNIGELKDRLTVLGKMKPTPKVKAEIAAAKAALAKLEAELKKLNGWKTNPKVTANTLSASASIREVIAYLNQVQSKTVTVTVNTKSIGAGRARGGIDVLNRATNFIAGEAGREIAAFFPLNDPSRSADLLSRLNSMMGGYSNVSAGASRLALAGIPSMTGGANRSAPGAVINNTVNVNVNVNAPVTGVDDLHDVIHSATMAAMEEAQVAEGRSLRGMVR